MVYVEGYALCSALGESSKISMQQEQNSTVEPTLLKDANKYFFIKNPPSSDYYKVMIAIAKKAIENAKLTQDEIANLGLFIGTSSAKLPLNEKLLREGKELLEEVNVSEICTILSEELKIQGFSTLISTACTSSANALLQAKEMIENGLIDKALVLGVELYNELSIKGFDSFLLLSKDKIRPFEQNRDGVILGEGISAVILGKKKSDFELIAGSSMVDTSSITSPSVDALVKVMQSAIEEAKIELKDISLIKAHATATIQNDAVEADAINQLFSTSEKILSLKPYIGHTMGACGTNELVLLMQMLSFGDDYGYSLLNYFGFGGNNCCLVLKYDGK